MPGIDRVAFYLFSTPVYWYGLTMASGILAGLIICMCREKLYGLEKDTSVTLALWAVPFALIGARLYYVAFSWEQYRNNLMSILDLRSGGLGLYGSMISGILVGYVFARKKRIPFLTLCDLAAPAFAMGQAIGRWGNFFNQEAYGIAVTNEALRFFPISVFIESDATWHLATFFYESIWCLALSIGLMVYERRTTKRKKGDVFLWYILLYALERAVVEGLRTDSLMLGSLRVSQILSIAAVVVCTAIVIARRKQQGDR
ncbi:MAG: prolipoprotein diacylglyceryl transferase [Clostridia bacterium]|nr:prolipoprotein diacylglyceryl transferase [Clostridia bacterium]